MLYKVDGFSISRVSLLDILTLVIEFDKAVGFSTNAFDDDTGVVKVPIEV